MKDTDTDRASSTALTVWLQRLENLHSREIDLGLERVGQVARRLQLPLQSSPERPRTITFAGTNGKGSTLAMTQAMALAAGLKVGSYTSPHFLHFNERIQIQGQPVTDAAIIAAFEKIEAARAEISLSYFEFATLAALVIFNQSDLDLWLLEVGLGGRLDAVNLVDADVAVVTTVALDHQEYLGDDLEGIGFEKAGIFRPGQAAVLGSRQLPASVRQQATALGCSIYQLGREFNQQDQQQTWCWQGSDDQGQALELPGLPWPQLPRDNAATAVQAVLLSGLPVSEEAIKQGLSQARVTGRMQRQGAWLLDVAHNPQAADYLSQQLAQEKPCRRLAIVGMMADKDQAATLSPLLAQVDAWLVTALPTPRAEQPEKLKTLLESKGGRVLDVFTQADGRQVFSRAQQLLGTGEFDQVVVLGSFFTVALFLDALQADTRSSCVTV
ncbi:bifunctional tetrahydrofolate synthase/dihydrofolate synthase [Marinospirillum sp.]|uniref:bifunctional tetrahydrofolate synthase/dihydrofolate synthase n=1 Tax=Marinospirillum sp. TaxID=2183934 RepID=UPI00384ACBE1